MMRSAVNLPRPLRASKRGRAPELILLMRARIALALTEYPAWHPYAETVRDIDCYFNSLGVDVARELTAMELEAAKS